MPKPLQVGSGNRVYSYHPQNLNKIIHNVKKNNQRNFRKVRKTIKVGKHHHRKSNKMRHYHRYGRSYYLCSDELRAQKKEYERLCQIRLNQKKYENRKWNLLYRYSHRNEFPKDEYYVDMKYRIGPNVSLKQFNCLHKGYQYSISIQNLFCVQKISDADKFLYYYYVILPGIFTRLSKKSNYTNDSRGWDLLRSECCIKIKFDVFNNKLELEEIICYDSKPETTSRVIKDYSVSETKQQERWQSIKINVPKHQEFSMSFFDMRIFKDIHEVLQKMKTAMVYVGRSQRKFQIYSNQV